MSNGVIPHPEFECGLLHEALNDVDRAVLRVREILGGPQMKEALQKALKEGAAKAATNAVKMQP